MICINEQQKDDELNDRVQKAKKWKDFGEIYGLENEFESLMQEYIQKEKEINVARACIEGAPVLVSWCVITSISAISALLLRGEFLLYITDHECHGRIHGRKHEKGIDRRGKSYDKVRSIRLRDVRLRDIRHQTSDVRCLKSEIRGLTSEV